MITTTDTMDDPTIRMGAGNDDRATPPTVLMEKCADLIEAYHAVHGFALLPNMLWKYRMGPVIERHRDLQTLLREASTTRSAKKANKGFVKIATTILSLEVLASDFAGWSLIYPSAAITARGLLRRDSREPPTPLLDFYLYPPRQISAAAVATLAPRRPFS